ncbi:hypothetical protein A2215_01745 [Candidatus Berkelbacteria bacterium RIFOXYA2_FULL_43_10]|uniref:Isoleucine--tRNA ligase n=1 Tax=Candidatus Berkelbacteria bacterium RIFOXYA2_FULL_43_10 TaxID=1797472 RepID=A0A1F5E709_9BACT|nr:MAG: hypothetical protein A2215_01745 [Candidatus Berkelbacteria bacterium RIFOXYA2_FULL_43_10]
MNFRKVDPKLDLPRVEEKILKFWDENKIFEKSLENRKDSSLYVFYDGPPFATGTPHYGHIVPSLMKDVIPRYFTMKGRLVERKWGWDCHGLPIENIAEKELGIKSKKQIEEMGVAKFNEFCRSKVLGYVTEWKKVIRRLGRWVDMENAYKTMDLPFMESVWWTFKQLYDKGLIYEGYRSMHVCPRCETTLSQSEVAEGYKDIKDLSVVVKFKIDDPVVFPDTYFLAWTTTPWTLLGNAALALSTDITYAKVKIKGRKEVYILAKDRIDNVFKNKDYEIVADVSAQTLVSTSYVPLFDFVKKDNAIKNYDNGWKAVPANFVTSDDGTGVVHIAPAFGEDDLNLGKEMDLPFIQHVGMDGIIKSGYGELSGLSVKPADDVQATDVAIIKYLDSKDLLFDKAQYEHSYPHCWRCEAPLINYATSSWFVAVEKVKDEVIGLAKEINWTPKHIKAGRFGMWLEGARDWSISRQRYWASVLPIWRCGGEAELKAKSAKLKSITDNSKLCKNIKVVGSVKELEELSGQKVTDLHKHIVDEITFKCEKCDGEMRRIPDVLDTWFDSGSMPYAQKHYPFENKEKFESNFPAEFIAEGVDQTRCWFYYLHIISTAIMRKPAYNNVIANGIVLAEDGKKMSKRLKNYPDPMEVFEKYGADILRLYLLSSPVMLAENLSLKESELTELQRGFFRMLWNSYYFFILYTTLDNWNPEAGKKISDNILDRWIVAKVEKLNLEVEINLKNYNLPGATRLFPIFVDELSNWYLRRSRRRFWKSESDKDKNCAYETMYFVLLKLVKLFAPFLPFIAEEMYKNLTGEESVHLADFPEADEKLIDHKIIESMDRTRKLVESGLSLRAASGIKVRQPLQIFKYLGEELPKDFERILSEELNVKEIASLKKIETTEIGETKFRDVWFDFKITPQLRSEGLAREVVRAIQGLRKETGLQVEDRIRIRYQTNENEIGSAIRNNQEYIAKETLAKEIKKIDSDIAQSNKIEIEGKVVDIEIIRVS